ncbi:hypothetical protein CANARDRAFT_30484 [[Candida] arabinofermentans NRRL YB-2248]|uniref:Amino acid permease/ SLC12A domain-containing protein n=1 Tax=[Candida] arabinofermentans NRRL YB-2248 TaxID=983967 RepID=A0A1E4SU24_9ASCO|nr:hypothetical protein CANARDRAFT_30484 [[Candida] arabinofermentans NRRL YB-2248]
MNKQESIRSTTSSIIASSTQAQDGKIGFFESFKRANVDLSHISNLDKLTPEQLKQVKLANQPFKKNLNSRIINMIAIAATLGTGLFIGIGYSLTSGPGALLIGFSLVGLAIYCVCQNAAELSVAYPVSGSFATHISRFLEPSLGFTVSTNYALSWLISFPSELIGCSMTITYWNDSINPVVWIAIFYVFVVFLNLCGVKWYGESEFIMSLIKVLAILIFIIIGIVLICGGGPNNTTGYIGMKYWHTPGSFVKPVFKSICNTFVSAAFSYGGTELVVLTAAESKKIESVSKASKQVFWRIAFFYITTVVIIGCLVPYNDERLLGGSSDEDITASPFVIALSNTGGSFGTKVSHFMNAVILVAVLSVCNSCVYASSRVIQSLAVTGDLPEIFAYVDLKGRPLMGILISCIFGLLGFLVASTNQDTVFTWLFALCSIASFFTWFCICFAQVRFRWALKAQGRSTNELAYCSQLGAFGGYLGVVLSLALIAGEIYVSAFPLGYSSSAEGFFQNCLSIPIMIVVYVGYKSYKRSWNKFLIPLKEIDLDSGRRYEDLELLKLEVAERKAFIRSKPFYMRVYHFLC